MLPSVRNTTTTMIRYFIFLTVIGALCSNAQAQRTFDVTIADSTYHMKQYWFVLYTKGDAAPLDSARSAELQQAHLDHQAEQGRRGVLVMAGPYGRNDDGWRGLLIYDCDTREEVEGYLKADPFVRSGHLEYALHEWYGAIGTVLR